MLTRRGLLVSGVAVAGVYGGGTLVRRAIEPRLTFEAMPGLPGFRRLVTAFGPTASVGTRPADLEF